MNGQQLNLWKAKFLECYTINILIGQMQRHICLNDRQTFFAIKLINIVHVLNKTRRNKFKMNERKLN